MQTTPENQAIVPSTAKGTLSAGKSTPVEFIELGLGLEMLLETHPVFADAIKAALMPLDGEFLFELPHGDKPDGKGRVAAIRLAYAGAEEQSLAFVVLADDGVETSVQLADGQPEHLTSFAEAFVDVLQQLEKIGAH
ncbi:hypothetical protein [Rhizobium sp. LjRoot254]|uniref:hypothetical protein n=1 Tax=Rhizobium sp. LjRoot254 TaxID=3342297 RepID=UPI003ECDEF6B